MNRATAGKLIAESPIFKQLAILSLISPAETEPYGLNKIQDSEKIEDAEKRNLQLYFSYYPKIAVAVHLGLATVDQTFLKEEKAVGFQVPAQWFFTVKSRTTESGGKLSKKVGLTDFNKMIPLAEKEIVDITGITAIAEKRVQVDFTWKWNANDVALALQENTNEFKELPIDIQKGLLGQTEGNHQNQTENWSGEHKGQALFQHYDDGWRVMNIINY